MAVRGRRERRRPETAPDSVAPPERKAPLPLRRRALGFGLVVLFAALLVGGGEYLANRLLPETCEPERIESLPLRHSRWVVESWTTGCGFASGPLNLYALNPGTREKIELGSLDDPRGTTLSLDDDDNLVISLPATAKLRNPRDSFGASQVIYRRTP